MKFEDMINNVILGDCYEIIKSIPDKSIDCIYVDVPYLYSLGGAGHNDLCKDTTKNKMELMGYGEYYNKYLTPQENMQIVYKLNEAKRIQNNSRRKEKNLIDADITKGFDYKKFLDEAFRVMKKCNLFIWCSPMQIRDILDYIYTYIQTTPTILVWCKSNPIPTTNNNWLSDIEYCIYVRDVGVKLNDGYELKSKYYISPINQSDKEKFNHPTIKPLNLVERHIKHATQENDIVLDCFCGSGTTCIACKNTNRRYIGIELNPKWHKVAVDRLNNVQADGQQTLFTM